MKLIEMYSKGESIQNTLKNIGDSGCYFISIVALCEQVTGKDIDIHRAFYQSLSCKHIDRYGFVINPNKIVHQLTGFECIVSKRNKSYKHTPLEFTIGRFILDRALGVVTHFVLLGHNNEIIFDPWFGSNTVKLGTLDSLRVFQFVGWPVTLNHGKKASPSA